MRKIYFDFLTRMLLVKEISLGFYLRLVKTNNQPMTWCDFPKRNRQWCSDVSGCIAIVKEGLHTTV
jgi:hypothetical protein